MYVYLLNGHVGLVINSKVDSSDAAGLVAVGDAGTRVSDVAECAMVVANDSTSKRRAGEISLDSSICINNKFKV